jgi:methionyl-tRNA formyltransferase
MRIIFMGTPDFAVESLRLLVENTEKLPYNVVAVVTVADKPAGRGQKLSTSAVKDYALSQNIPVLQPTNLKAPEFLAELSSYQADLQIVVAFRMLPQTVWAMPKYGTFNLHASLLPQYRGAAPINWAVMNGETETGVTTFFLQQEIDTGDIILKDTETISLTDTAGDLHDRLMEKGAKLVVETVKQIINQSYTLQKQILVKEIKLAPKLHTDMCFIDTSQTAKQVYDKIRGLSPYPAARILLQGKLLKIYHATYHEGQHDKKKGEMDSDNKNYLHIFVNHGYISLKEVQLEGKKRMEITEFLRGYRFQ